MTDDTPDGDGEAEALASLAEMLAQGLDAGSKDADGDTLLIVAARDGNIAAVRMLLDHGAAIDAVDDNGATALAAAAKAGHVNVARLLLDKGANVGAADKYGDTALGKALRAGHPGMACLLIEKNAAIDDVRDFLQTGSKGQGAVNDVIRAVLARAMPAGTGLDNAAGLRSFANAALFSAAREGHVGMMRELLEAGADVDGDGGSTPLMAAADGGHNEAVKLLIERGADIDHKAPDGWSAITRALDKNFQETAQLLISYPAELKAKAEKQRQAKAAFDDVVNKGLPLAADLPVSKPLRLVTKGPMPPKPPA